MTKIGRPRAEVVITDTERSRNAAGSSHLPVSLGVIRKDEVAGLGLWCVRGDTRDPRRRPVAKVSGRGHE